LPPASPLVSSLLVFILLTECSKSRGSWYRF
jgi:hypothetical protein